MAAADQLAERIGDLARGAGRWVGVAESLTGGMVCSRLARVEGSSEWFRGGIVSYSRLVKHQLLGVPPGPVVSEASAKAMAAAAGHLLSADATVSLTGVGGPDPQDGLPPGTVWVAVSARGAVCADLHRFSGSPSVVCDQAAEAALASLERALGTWT